MFVPLSFCVCCNILYHSSELLTNGPINVLQCSVVGGGHYWDSNGLVLYLVIGDQTSFWCLDTLQWEIHDESHKNLRKRSSLLQRKILNNWCWHVPVFVWRLYLNIILSEFWLSRAPPLPSHLSPSPQACHFTSECLGTWNIISVKRYTGTGRVYQLDENFPGLLSL